MNIGFLSYSLGAVAFLILSVLLIISWRGREVGALLFSASAITTVWAFVLAVHSFNPSISSFLIWTVELSRIAFWLIFIQRLLRLAAERDRSRSGWFVHFRYAVYGMIASLLAIEWSWPLIESVFDANLKITGCLVLVLIGMVMIEQLYRNTRFDRRWAIKFLCLAIGSQFTYDFYLYSDALIFGHIDSNLWTARGVIVALGVPLIAVSAARNRDWSVNLFISRGLIFHTTTLLAAGLYLVLMGAAGYYIQAHGGSWGKIAQIVFLVGASIMLALLLLSGQIRSWFRVFLSKHFFTYTYDYRQEWLGIISILSESDAGLSLPQRVILALATLVESSGGVLWVTEDQRYFRKRADFGDPDIDIDKIDADCPLIKFMTRQQFVVNLDELNSVPELYEGINRPDWLEPYRNAWVIVPLLQSKELYGLVLLTTPRTTIVWNWEVIDILKTAGIQVASYLALEDAASALAEARQFEGFNRLSAFVILDLKNVIAQLSLVVRNAERHRDNPEFMIDAIKTVEHSVDKMNRLMSQLRSAGRVGALKELSIHAILKSVVGTRARQRPRPSLEILDAANPVVHADEDRLSSAFEHIIQNAQEAAGKSGNVQVTLQTRQKTAIVEIKDSGQGMDQQFIETRLFKPFDTTKGLTGMGIGAYESREYIRLLGGELNVVSEIGIGSVFRFQIPILFVRSPENSALQENVFE